MILSHSLSCYGIESGDTVSIRRDPNQGTYAGKVGDSRSESYAGIRSEIGKRLVLRVEATEISLLTSDPYHSVRSVTDRADGVADEGMWRVIGDKAAEADLVCHPASKTSIPSPCPDITIPVAEQATDTLASEGGDVQLIRELFLY
jgi:hypothetical protein